MRIHHDGLGVFALTFLVSLIPGECLLTAQESVPLPPIIAVDQAFVSADGQASFEIDELETVSYDGESYFDASKQRRWFAGVELTVLRPNSARPQISNFANDIASDADFRDIESFYAAPRLVIGTKKGDRGLQFRYWHLRLEEAEFSDPFQPAGGFTELSETSLALDVSTIDAELFKEYSLGRINGRWLLGSRYVNFESDARAQATDFFGDEVGTITSFQQRNYEGIGVLFGLTGSAPMRGRRGSRGWNWFWNGRVAGVFGTNFDRQVSAASFDGNFAVAESIVRNSSTTSRTEFDSDSIAESRAIADDDNTLWTFEGQFGIEHKRPLAGLAGTAYFRFGVEYQYWDFPDSTARNSLIVSSRTLPGFLPERTAGFGLTGFVVSTGVNF